MNRRIRLTALAAILVIPGAHAALLTLESFSPGGAQLETPSGDPFPNGGFVALYVFGAGDGAPPTDMFAAVANGSNGLLSLAPLDDGMNGGMEGSFFAAMGFANDGSIIGQNIYFMVGNGRDAASSTALALVDLNLSPTVSDRPPPGWVISSGEPGSLFAPAPEDVIIGRLDNNGDLRIGIPEPSSSILMGIAGLAFLVRRKR